MRIGEYDLRGLRDSRLLYMRGMPRLGYVFAVASVAIVVAILAWSMVATHADEIEAPGIVVAGGSEAVASQASGIVAAVLLSEGDAVNEGDIIAKLDSSDLGIAIKSLSAERGRLSGRIALIDKFVSETRKPAPAQPFRDTGEEAEFRALFERYLSDLDASSQIPGAVLSLNAQTRSALLAERSGLSASLISIDADIESNQAALARCEIKALRSGVLHMDVELKRGASVQAGSVLGSISAPGESRHVEMLVPPRDRSRIEVGQECRFAVDGLPRAEYGSVCGTVESISENATLSQSGAYFRVTVSFDVDRLSDPRGSAVTIHDGATVSVWIVCDETTEFRHWMGQLGLDWMF